MSRFDAAFAHVLSWEGDYSDDKDDPGGRTKYGISERAHPEAWTDGPPDLAKAEAIYHSRYWDPCHCATLPAPVGFYLFDTAVNVGVPRASKLLQEACGAYPDGIVGPKTIEAVKRTGNPTLNLAAKRAEYYATLGMDKYLFGWMRRVVDTYEKARSA